MQSGTPQRVDGPTCSVCGSVDVMRDEVMESEIIQIAECRHCEHRWTSLLAAPITMPANRGPVTRAGRKGKIPSAA